MPWWGRLMLGPCDLHLCSQGHSVYAPIIPGLGWLKWKSGWCQWLSHFVHSDARRLFHGVCFLCGFSVTCRFLWFHTKRSIRILTMDILVINLSNFFLSVQPSKKHVLILSCFFFHTKWITKYIDHSFTQWEFSLLVVFQGHSCSVAIARCWHAPHTVDPL